ncbi:MAG: hypothetical protein WKF28_04695, partial [Rubrobacteraceae bacterium]
PTVVRQGFFQRASEAGGQQRVGAFDPDAWDSPDSLLFDRAKNRPQVHTFRCFEHADPRLQPFIL